MDKKVPVSRIFRKANKNETFRQQLTLEITLFYIFFFFLLSPATNRAEVIWFSHGHLPSIVWPAGHSGQVFVQTARNWTEREWEREDMMLKSQDKVSHIFVLFLEKPMIFYKSLKKKKKIKAGERHVQHRKSETKTVSKWYKDIIKNLSEAPVKYWPSPSNISPN